MGSLVVRHMSVYNFERHPLKHLDQLIFPTSYEPSVEGGSILIYINGHGPLIKMAAMLIYGKNIKHLLLQNQALRIYSNGNVPRNKITTIPVYGKNA